MKDPANIYTRRGTPLILIVSRIGFAIYFAFVFYSAIYHLFPQSVLTIYWAGYLLILYLLAERVYAEFLQKKIDLTFAFPLLLSIYILHFISLLIRGQEDHPLMNRAEHFTSFVMMGYIVWVFFLKYLPQKVWQRHPYYTALLVLSVTSLAGVSNEIFELLFDKLLHTHMIGPGYDTALDLLMNTLGAGLFLAVRLILIAGDQVIV